MQVADVIRNADLMDKWVNDRPRLLIESVVVPEVNLAFKDWCNNIPSGKWMVIGGLVVSAYIKPRMTMDIDILFPSEGDLPSAVEGFKRNIDHSYQHNKTHVEVEAITPTHINLPKNVYDEVFAKSVVNDGIRMPSVNGLLTLKVMSGRANDVSDIVAILEKFQDANIEGFNVPKEKINDINRKLEPYGFKL